MPKLTAYTVANNLKVHSYFAFFAADYFGARKRRMPIRCRTKKLNFKKILGALVCFTVVTIIIYSIIHYKQEHDEDGKNYFHYYVYPNSTKINATKIIFLWTPLQGKYKEWSWGIGPEPTIDDCNDANVDGRCLVTTHLDLLEKADVVLFSIEDIKRVGCKGI